MRNRFRRQLRWLTSTCKPKDSATCDLSLPELLQILAAQEKEQKENPGRALRRLENLLKQALERIPELQVAVTDW